MRESERERVTMDRIHSMAHIVHINMYQNEQIFFSFFFGQIDIHTQHMIMVIEAYYTNTIYKSTVLVSSPFNINKYKSRAPPNT